VYNIASKGESKYKSELKLEEIINLMKGAIGKKTVPTIEPELRLEQPEIKKLETFKEEAWEEPIVIKEVTPKQEIIIEKLAPKKDTISKKTLLNWTIKELKDYCKEQEIEITSKARKNEIIDKILDSYTVEKISKKPEEPKLKVSEIIRPKPRPATTSVKQTLIRTKAQPTPPRPKSTQTTLPIITTDRILKVLTDEWQTVKHLIFKLKIKDMMDARYLQLKLKELERKGDVLVEVKMGRKQWKLK